MSSKTEKHSNKVGRPKLPKEQRRGEITPIRLNEDERELFQRVADENGLTLSDWIRSTLNAAVKK